MQELIGQTLGQYRIVEQIGKGGMATVFKAYQPSLDRYVAIKVLPPYFAHEEGFSERFIREARAIAHLDHPHILPIYDYGQEGEMSYIVMKYVDAGTLKDVIGDRPMSLEWAADVISQVAEALDYAHGQGVIHRDVKPANVLMDRGEWALLTDFGLAKIVGGSQRLTASGVGVGTPAYMAPEQGQGRPVDARADIYSLGIVLYEMLTGRVPYEAETPLAIVLKHVTEPLPLPRLVNPEIPEPVELVILKALAKNPDDRYQSAGEMAEALRHAVAETRAMEEVQAWGAVTELEPLPDVYAVGERPLSPVGPDEEEEAVGAPPEVEEGEKELGRAHVLRPAYVLGALLLLAIIAGGGWLLWGRGGEGKPTSTAGAVVAVASPTTAPTFTPSSAVVVSNTPATAPTFTPSSVAVVSGTPTSVPTSVSIPTVSTPTPVPVSASPVAARFRVAITTKDDNAKHLAEEYLSQELGTPVEIVAVESESEVVDLLKAHKVEFALMSMLRYLSLRGGPLSMLPVVYAQPFFSGVTVVRKDGDIGQVSELNGKRVAVSSWSDPAGIMGRAALIEKGIDIERDCDVLFVADRPSVEAEVGVVIALYEGRADAAIISSWTLQMLNEHDSEPRRIMMRAIMRSGSPGRPSPLQVLVESLPTSVGILVARLDVDPDVRSGMSSAFEGMDKSLCRALTSYDGLRWTSEPLADNLDKALTAVGLRADQVARGDSGTEVRIALLPAAGATIERNAILRQVYAEVEQVGKDLGVETLAAETPGDQDPYNTAQKLIGDGYTVVVAVGWQDMQRVWELAHEHPDVRFVALGSRFKVPLPNLTGVVYRVGEGSFVAGALAGKATESGKVAILVSSGDGSGQMEQMVQGFSRGVKGACAECEVVVAEVPASSDVERAEGQLESLAEAGVDVVFAAAGNIAGEEMWLITLEWGDSDIARRMSNPRFLGAVIVRVNETAYTLIADAARGQEGRNESLGFKEKGLSFVLSQKAAHPRLQELDKYVTGLVAGLKAGRLAVD